MAGLSALQQNVAKLEAAAEDIRAATREAHEKIKELRQAEKAIRDLLKTEARELVEASIKEAVAVGLAAYSDEIKRAQEKAVDHVGAVFEELARIYLEGDVGSPGRKSIPELVEGRLRQLRELRRYTAGAG